MIYVGLDVAKDKHDCCILMENGEMAEPVFRVQNDRAGFELLFSKIRSYVVNDGLNSDQTEVSESKSALGSVPESVSHSNPVSSSNWKSRVRVGLEATGHFSYNLLHALLEMQLPTYLINPLHTNFFHKGISLRKTKTDRVDASVIASMLMHDNLLQPYTNTAFFAEELKSLTRYRFDKVLDRSRLKVSIARLVTILFPELDKLLPNLHSSFVYSLLYKYPGAAYIAEADPECLLELILESSRGHHGKETADAIHEAASGSIGISSASKSLELKCTIRMIRVLDEEIESIEAAIRSIMDTLQPPILTIPGISYRMGAMILAEVGDFSRFPNADKLLAYAGLSPSTYQSGQLVSTYCHMEKRGSKYLRYALFNTARYVCQWDPSFGAYLQQKLNEHKHYNVAISHAAKKLVRVIWKLQTSNKVYRAA